MGMADFVVSSPRTTWRLHRRGVAIRLLSMRIAALA
jgi:hypothetical protein